MGLLEGEEFTSGTLEPANLALDGSLKQLSDDGELVGKSGTSTLIHTLGKVTPKRILFTGLGKRDSVTEKVIKDVVSAAIRKARGIGLTKVVVAIDTFCSEDLIPQGYVS